MSCLITCWLADTHVHPKLPDACDATLIQDLIMLNMPHVALQIFWKLLSASDKPAWQTSSPIPLIPSGNISAAEVAVSSNATLTVALQSGEQPNRVQIITMKGNPIALSIGGEGSLPVQCQPVGSLDIPKGETLVHFLFEPQSAGWCL